MGKKYVKQKKLTILQQALLLRGWYPEAECKTKKSSLDWKGVIIPTPLSGSYIVNILYKSGSSPKTYVIEPKLSTFQNEKLPHVYSQNEQRLCLYYPRGGGEWNETMYIARTIVPWASEWLFFYELWLATGEWLGGGIHVVDTDKEDSK